MTSNYKLILFIVASLVAIILDNLLFTLSHAPSLIFPILTIFFIIRSGASSLFLWPIAIYSVISDVMSGSIFGVSTLVIIMIFLVVHRAIKTLNLGGQSMVGTFISVLFFLWIFIGLTAGVSYIIEGGGIDAKFYFSALLSSSINIFPVILIQTAIVAAGFHFMFSHAKKHTSQKPSNIYA